MGGKESKNPQLVGTTYLWRVEIPPDISGLKPKFSAYFEVFGDSCRLELHSEKNLELKLHRKEKSDVLKKFRCVSAFLDHRGFRYHSETKDVEIGKSTGAMLLLNIPQTVLDDVPDFAFTHRFYFSLKLSSVDDDSGSSALDLNSTAETLSSDLGKIYNSGIGSDVKICSNPGEEFEFEAHRLILSARSPVFEAMFRNNTEERSKGVVNIPDVEESILASLMLYLYTGKVHGLCSSNAAQLIQVADKYHLQDLKETCLQLLLANLTVDNICDAVVLAQMYDIPSLKEQVHAFISEHTPEVLQSENWKALQVNNPDIVNSVLATLLVSAKSK